MSEQAAVQDPPETEAAAPRPAQVTDFTFHESVERKMRMTGSWQLLLALDDLVEIEDPRGLKEALGRVLANMKGLLARKSPAKAA